MPKKTKAEADAFMNWWEVNRAEWPTFEMARDEWELRAARKRQADFRAALAAVSANADWEA